MPTGSSTGLLTNQNCQPNFFPKHEFFRGKSAGSPLHRPNVAFTVAHRIDRAVQINEKSTGTLINF